MGEYAKRKSDESKIKIGTCEQMFYLRADQRHLVTPLWGNVNPTEDRYEIRFRFPWPDEDEIQPGEFADHERTLVIPGAKVPDGVEHRSIQFSAAPGYLVSLPCPEGPSTHGLRVGRNGFSGAVTLHSQKMLRDGRTAPVCSCNGCGALYRVEEAHEIEALAVALRAEVDRFQNDARTTYFREVANRVLRDAGIKEASR